MLGSGIPSYGSELSNAISNFVSQTSLAGRIDASADLFPTVVVTGAPLGLPAASIAAESSMLSYGSSSDGETGVWQFIPQRSGYWMVALASVVPTLEAQVFDVTDPARSTNVVNNLHRWIDPLQLLLGMEGPTLRPTGDILTPVEAGRVYELRLGKHPTSDPSLGSTLEAVSLFFPLSTNDSPVRAEPMPSRETVDLTVSTTGGSDPVGDAFAGSPIHGAVWFRWTAPRSGRVELSTLLIAAPPEVVSTVTEAALPRPDYDSPGAIPADKELWIVPKGFGETNAGNVLVTGVVSSLGSHNATVEIRTGGTSIGIVPNRFLVDLDARPAFKPLFVVLSGEDRNTVVAQGTNFQLSVTAGETLLIGVGSESPAIGVTPLHLRLVAPPNDLFADQVPLSGVAGTFSGHLIGAGVEPSEPVGGGASAWWSWTAPDDGNLYFEQSPLSNGTLPATAAVYSGGQLSELKALTTRQGGSFALSVEAGATYSIAIQSPQAALDYYLWAYRLERLPPRLAIRNDANPTFANVRLDLSHHYGRLVRLSVSEDLGYWIPIWQGRFAAPDAIIHDFTTQSVARLWYKVELITD